MHRMRLRFVKLEERFLRKSPGWVLLTLLVRPTEVVVWRHPQYRKKIVSRMNADEWYGRTS